MPRYGGIPYPARFGGGEAGTRDPLLKIVYESIAAARGSAYDQVYPPQTAVGIENMAIARAITYDVHESNRRFINQFFASTMTDPGLLPRWERIFNVPAQPGDTLRARQGRIAMAWLRWGALSSPQAFIDALRGILGSLFLGIVNFTPANARMWWPVAPGPTPWYSTIAHVDIHVDRANATYFPTAGKPNALYWSTIALVGPVLDDLLPAWVTWTFYIDKSSGGMGFKLDEPNLDLEALT